jgi:7-keto-8-aminopelargonate synthetase-like enzyme
LQEVGCGTCGPRGFYGTTVDHLELEKRIAEFIGTDKSIIYSMHVATASSVIPAFMNRDDLILTRYSMNPSIISGIRLTRSQKVQVWDTLEELEALLSAVNKTKLLRTNPHFRVWIICEGGMKGFKLNEIVNLKTAYGAYLFLDDSLCIGVSGRTGRGSIEHFGVSVNDVDIIIGSLEHAFGTVGGFCCGRADVIEHQRLSASGYCFSASCPTSLVVAGYRAIDFLRTPEGEQRLEQLQDNIKLFVDALAGVAEIELLSSPECYSQVVKLPKKITSTQLYNKLKLVRAQPLRVSPMVPLILKKFPISKEYPEVEQMIKFTIDCNLKKEDILAVIKDIRACL